MAVQRFFKQGHFIFKEGDPSRSIFIVKKGTVSIRKAKGAAWVEIARVYPNEVIGELSFFDRLPRSASAAAATDVEVMEITFEALDQIYSKIPDYMKTIMAAMAERLRKANEMIRKLQKTMGPDGSAPPTANDTAISEAPAPKASSQKASGS